jgi:hypothetical protein
MVWSVRNAVYSGVIDALLRHGVRVQLCLPRSSEAAERGEDFTVAELHPLVRVAERPVPGRDFFEAALQSAFARRGRLRGYGIYQRWFHRRDRWPARARQAAVEAVGAALRPAPLFAAARAASRRLDRRAHDRSAVRAQLAELAPDLLWSTVSVHPAERPYAIAARELGIPVLSSVLSFDNLTSRGLIPVADYYTVWSARMRDRLVSLYPEIPSDRVQVTGTPQFDFHRRPEFRWSRAETLAALGLPPDARYLLYAASHQQLAPDEPALVAALARRLADDPDSATHHLVVRLHPLDDGRRWEALRLAAGGTVRLVTAWERPAAADGWTLSSPRDQARLVSTLAHADACLNVASTMSLDAALLDRPVIGLALAEVVDAPREILYAEYDCDHYRPLVASGGIDLAHDWGELRALVRRALRQPDVGRAARARMVAEECGPVDGASAARVADAIVHRLGCAAAAADPPPRAVDPLVGAARP